MSDLAVVRCLRRLPVLRPWELRRSGVTLCGVTGHEGWGGQNDKEVRSAMVARAYLPKPQTGKAYHRGYLPKSGA